MAAGILRDVSFHKMSKRQWDIVHRVHVYGAFKVCDLFTIIISIIIITVIIIIIIIISLLLLLIFINIKTITSVLLCCSHIGDSCCMAVLSEAEIWTCHYDYIR